jgi:hypothetical protein
VQRHRGAPVAHRVAHSSGRFVISLVSSRDLPHVRSTVFGATEAGRPSGMLLLLSSLALGTLAVASFTLLRRLARMHQEWTERSA